jgi:hypothetical protein
MTRWNGEQVFRGATAVSYGQFSMAIAKVSWTGRSAKDAVRMYGGEY